MSASFALAQRIRALPALRQSLLCIGGRFHAPVATRCSLRVYSRDGRKNFQPHQPDDVDARTDLHFPLVSEATRTKIFDRIKASALGYVSRKPYSRRDLSDKLAERFLPRSESNASQNYQSRFLQKTLIEESKKAGKLESCVPSSRQSASDASVPLPREAQQEILSSIINEVCDRFEQVHLLNDEEYAVVFARSKWRQSKWSPRKIEGELRRRGVEDEVVGAALEHVFGEEKRIEVCEVHEDERDEEGDGVMNIHARELIEMARKQYESYRSASITEEAKKRRLIGYLQRRGFGWDVVGKVVARVTGKIH